MGAKRVRRDNEVDVRVGLVALRRDLTPGNRQSVIFETAITGNSETRLARAVPGQDLS